MNIVEKLLEREIIVDHERFQSLTDHQVKQLEEDLEELSNDEVQNFFDRGSVEILRSYTKKPVKRKYQDFVGHFRARLDALSTILRSRQELASPQSIANIQENEQVALIGLVWDKYETKNGHWMFSLEDRTGTIKVLVSKSRTDLWDQAEDIMPDEVIGITGKCGGDIVFADSILIPDVPASHELKKAPDDAYAVFISDLHFGNKEFLTDAFNNVLGWLRGEVGSSAHKAVAKKVKYVFIAGDMIEGVGYYPGQYDDLAIHDIRDQYKLFSETIAKIPQSKQIIICPGNHDAGRLAEPQMDLYSDFAPDFIDQPNVHLVSNPGWVRIHRSKNFEGFTALLYHGFSFTYYGDKVPSIFANGGVNNAAAIMKYLLQRRHLAPTHTSNMYIPDPTGDPLVIHDVPDFFVSGHIHMAAAENYRGVSLLNCSCWVPPTAYQDKFGLKPDPGKLVLVNLKTRQTRFLSFHKGADASE